MSSRIGPRLESAEVSVALASLPEREATILRLRYGLGEDCLAAREVGMRLGLGEVWVKVIERSALRKLRAASCAERLSREHLRAATSCLS